MIPSTAHALADNLRSAPEIRAMFLGGSHGTGLADAYSNLDFVLVVPEGLTDDLAALWKSHLAKLGELILWRDRQVASTLINAIIVPDLRIDALFLKPDQLGRYAQDGIKVLFDHDDIATTLRPDTPHGPPDPKRLAWQFEEFIRILALLPLAIGREEYINGVTGIGHLRNLLIELLIAETNVPLRGGALQINRLLSQEQQDLLIGLPPLIPTRDDVIAAHTAYAAAYLPRARALADTHNVPWPARFETVTLANLERTLDVTLTPPPRP
ncbi:nucleotidyltransferase domain-containing protein [Gymnodinialimonas sp. 2305UL16-5]|uniref:nucleotidyltransferase domain-containing protein n=1 Tax=Gymnodinialimonas mytili TaxID=3126503 RepID=UPI0030B366D8